MILQARLKAGWITEADLRHAAEASRPRKGRPRSGRSADPVPPARKN